MTAKSPLQKHISVNSFQCCIHDRNVRNLRSQQITDVIDANNKNVAEFEKSEFGAFSFFVHSRSFTREKWEDFMMKRERRQETPKEKERSRQLISSRISSMHALALGIEVDAMDAQYEKYSGSKHKSRKTKCCGRVGTLKKSANQKRSIDILPSETMEFSVPPAIVELPPKELSVTEERRTSLNQPNHEEGKSSLGIEDARVCLANHETHKLKTDAFFNAMERFEVDRLDNYSRGAGKMTSFFSDRKPTQVDEYSKIVVRAARSA